MTNPSYNCPPRAAEGAAPAFVHSPASRQFRTMTFALMRLIEAERDLDHAGDGWDPALDIWIRDAEMARSDLAEALDALCDTAPGRIEDAPLRRHGLILRQMIRCDSSEVLRACLSLFQVHQPLLRCQEGSHPLAHRVNQMIDEAHRLRAVLFALPDYAGSVIEVNCTGLDAGPVRETAAVPVAPDLLPTPFA